MTKRIRFFAQRGSVALAVFLFAAILWGQQQATVPVELVSYPDLILYNGKIVSMDDASLSNAIGRTYQAMAVRGERIQFLGSTQDVLRYAGPQTRKIDLKGRTVTPGFIDTHNHLHNQAVSRWAQKNPDKVESIARSFNVTGKSYADLTKGIELIIKEQMAHPAEGQWGIIIIPGSSTGTGIGVQYLATGEMDREKLDKLAPKLPIFVDAHPRELMNTAARNDYLSYYAVEPTDENEDKILNPQVGRALISERYFDRHLSELADVVEEELRYQVAGGFTTYSSHIVGLRFMPAFRMLVESGRMPMRFAFAHRYCQQVTTDNAGCFLRLGDWQGYGDKNQYIWNVGLTLGGIDSGPPSFCTTMQGPKQYKDQEKCNIKPGNVYYEAIKTAIKSRYRYVINHAYGDKSVEQVLDIIDEVMKGNPDITPEFIRSLRMTTDHCGYYPTREQLPHLKRLGFMTSCGAQYINRSQPWLKVYGERYADRIVPVKNVIDAGVMPTGELSALDYLKGDGEGPTMTAYMSWLITRRNARGDIVASSQAVDRATVMKMITVWASYYVLKEKELGTLEPGKLADFVVFNKDYFTVPDSEFGSAYPVLTVVGGKTANLREEFAKELGAAPVGVQLKYKYVASYNFGDELKPAKEDD